MEIERRGYALTAGDRTEISDPHAGCRLPCRAGGRAHQAHDADLSAGPRRRDRTAEEEEYEIDEATYRAALRVSDPARLPIQKTRYAIPYAGHVMEVDIYTFWDDRATLEVELTDEEEEFLLPPYLSVIAEVTADRRYKNAQLAKEIPYDTLPPENEHA